MEYILVISLICGTIAVFLILRERDRKKAREKEEKLLRREKARLEGLQKQMTQRNRQMLGIRNAVPRKSGEGHDRNPLQEV